MQRKAFSVVLFFFLIHEMLQFLLNCWYRTIHAAFVYTFCSSYPFSTRVPQSQQYSWLNFFVNTWQPLGWMKDLTCIDFNPSANTKQMRLYKLHSPDLTVKWDHLVRHTPLSVCALTRPEEDISSPLIVDPATNWTESETLNSHSLCDESSLVSGETWYSGRHFLHPAELEDFVVISNLFVEHFHKTVSWKHTRSHRLSTIRS